jgi:Uma2 family endonuclease
MSAANRMSAADFLAWDAPDGSDRWELIDGQPVPKKPNALRHGALTVEATRLLANHLAGHPRCRVFSEAAISPDEHNVRIPDLVVSCESLGLDDLLREPILIVEILSPGNARDRYMTIASVRETLVLHPTEVKAELLRREFSGSWTRLVLAARDTLSLMSVGLELPLADFYRTAAA